MKYMTLKPRISEKAYAQSEQGYEQRHAFDLAGDTFLIYTALDLFDRV